MLIKENVQNKEESIRGLVRELPDAARLEFFQQSEKKLKDPDTYATLNYIFIAGLHHFYLKRWWFGVMNLFCFLGGVLACLKGNTSIGTGMIVFITVFEAYELMRSQIIVQNYNNKIMESIYKKLTKSYPAPIESELEKKAN